MDSDSMLLRMARSVLENKMRTEDTKSLSRCTRIENVQTYDLSDVRLSVSKDQVINGYRVRWASSSDIPDHVMNALSFLRYNHDKSWYIEPSIARKLRHETVFHVLGADFPSDMRLESVFPNLKGGQTLTPDLILNLNERFDSRYNLKRNSFLILELKTTASHLMDVRWKDAKLSYERFLPEAGYNVFLSPLIVSDSHVFSGAPISEDDASDLCFSFKLGQKIMSMIKSADPSFDEFSDVDSRAVEDVYEKLKIAGNRLPEDNLRIISYTGTLSKFLMKYHVSIEEFQRMNPGIYGSHISGNFKINDALLMSKNFARVVKEFQYDEGEIVNDLIERSRDAYEKRMNECNNPVDLFEERYKKFESEWLSDMEIPKTLLDYVHPKGEESIYKISMVRDISDMKPPCSVAGALPLKQILPEGESIFAHIGASSSQLAICLQSSDRRNLLARSYEVRLEQAMNSEGRVISNQVKSNRVFFHKNVWSSLSRSEPRMFFGLASQDTKDQLKINDKAGQKYFGPNTITSDIEGFIMSGDLLQFDDILNHDNDQCRSIIDLADRMSGGGRLEMINTIWKLQNLPIIRMSSFLDQVFREINLSVRGFVNQAEVILKKIPNYDAWLMIRPQSDKTSLFYKIIILKTSFRTMGSIFPDWKEDGNLLFSHTMSATHSDVSHYCDTSKSLLSHFFNMMTMNDYQLSDYQHAIKNPIITSRMMILFLVGYENKSQSSASLQQFRYIFNELVKEDPKTTDPGKCLKKIDFKMRSRLMVFLFKKMISHCRRSLEKQIRVAPLKNPSETKMINLFCPWTAEEMNFKFLLFDSYLGNIHNKDKASYRDSLKLAEKIIKMERGMEKITGKTILGLGNPGDIKGEGRDPHYWSLPWTVCAADKVKMLIESTRGSCEDYLRSEVLRQISQVTIDDYATFKASAILNPEEFFSQLLPGSFDKDQANIMTVQLKSGSKRRKVCLAILDEIKKGKLDHHRLFSNIDKIFDEVDEQGGTVANLFKKNQHGGVREIYVLDIMSRLSVLYLEKTSRIICEELLMEMLTKSKKKGTITKNHYKQVQSLASSNLDKYTTVSAHSSDDASTWAQGFIMTTFGAMLCRLLPNDILYPCLRALNNISQKRLEMPTDIMRLFLKFPELASSSNEMNEYKAQWLGVKEGLITDENYLYMYNQSNMMQGIAHYTSSALHCCHVFMLKTIMSSHFKKVVSLKHNLDPKTVRLVTTFKVSSDDSEMINTISFDDKTQGFKQIEEFKTILRFYDTMKATSYFLIGATQSKEKSTGPSFSGINEFNSQWLFGSSVVIPSIKFAEMAIKTKVESNLLERQGSFANARKALLEAGATTEQCALVSILQAQVYYTTLGMGINDLFGELVRGLEDAPHPALGFFLFEPVNIDGWAGLEMARFTAFSKSKEMRQVENWLLKTQAPEIMPGVGPAVSVTFELGMSSKYKSFMRDVESFMTVESAKECMRKNPSLFFFRPRDIEGVKAKIVMRCNTKGALKAFGFLSKGQIDASAVYILASPCMKMILWEKEKAVTKKVSLLRLLTYVDKTTEMKFNISEILYPHHREMQQILEISERLKNLKYFRGRPNLPVEMVRVSIDPQPEEWVSLVELTKMMWFPDIMRPKSTQRMNAQFERFSQILPWLRKTWTQTLLESKKFFDDEFSLAGFIIGFDPRQKQLSALGQMQQGRDVATATEQLINVSHKAGMMSNSTNETMTQLREIQLYALTLCRSLLAPVSKKLKREIMSKVLAYDLSKMTTVDKDSKVVIKNVGTIDQLLDVPDPKDKKLRSIILMNQLYNSKISLEDALIRKTDELMTYWVTPQKKIRSFDQYGRERISWKGYGSIIAALNKKRIRAHMMDDKVFRIESEHPAKDVQHIISRLLDHLRMDVGLSKESSLGIITYLESTPQREITWIRPIREGSLVRTDFLKEENRLNETNISNYIERRLLEKIMNNETKYRLKNTEELIKLDFDDQREILSEFLEDLKVTMKIEVEEMRETYIRSNRIYADHCIFEPLTSNSDEVKVSNSLNMMSYSLVTTGSDMILSLMLSYSSREEPEPLISCNISNLDVFNDAMVYEFIKTRLCLSGPFLNKSTMICSWLCGAHLSEEEIAKLFDMRNARFNTAEDASRIDSLLSWLSSTIKLNITAASDMAKKISRIRVKLRDDDYIASRPVPIDTAMMTAIEEQKTPIEETMESIIFSQVAKDNYESAFPSLDEMRSAKIFQSSVMTVSEFAFGSGYGISTPDLERPKVPVFIRNPVIDKVLNEIYNAQQQFHAAYDESLIEVIYEERYLIPTDVPYSVLLMQFIMAMNRSSKRNRKLRRPDREEIPTSSTQGDDFDHPLFL